jgi:MOSC domain-containing protein YiiM
VNAGRVLAVCLGPGGLPNHPVESAQVNELGLVGDAHKQEFHGGSLRAVCVFATEDYARLERDRVGPFDAGSYGENVLTEGLDFEGLAPGDVLEIGPEVRLEIHDVRSPCSTLKAQDGRFPDLMLGRSGFLCRVVQGGLLQAGMAIGVQSAPPAADMAAEPPRKT